MSTPRAARPVSLRDGLFRRNISVAWAERCLLPTGVFGSALRPRRVGLTLSVVLMTTSRSRVTVHMAASLDGYVARADGRVDWLETTDEFAAGATLEPSAVAAFLQSIDCYVMGARTYETALAFEAQGLGWAYGDTPTIVLTHRPLPRTRATVEFYTGDLAALVAGRLRSTYHHIWVAGGSAVATACLQQGLADELRYTIVPVAIGDGLRFFGRLDHDLGLHLVEVTAYRNGHVELRYEIRDRPPI